MFCVSHFVGGFFIVWVELLHLLCNSKTLRSMRCEHSYLESCLRIKLWLLYCLCFWCVGPSHFLSVLFGFSLCLALFICSLNLLMTAVLVSLSETDDEGVLVNAGADSDSSSDYLSTGDSSSFCSSSSGSDSEDFCGSIGFSRWPLSCIASVGV